MTVQSSYSISSEVHKRQSFCAVLSLTTTVCFYCAYTVFGFEKPDSNLLYAYDPSFLIQCRKRYFTHIPKDSTESRTVFFRSGGFSH